MSCLNLVVLVHHLGVQRLIHIFVILTLLLLLTLQFFGIEDVLSCISSICFPRTRISVQLLLDAASKDSFTVRILFFNSAVLPFRLESRLYSSTSRFIASFDTHLLSLKPLAIGRQLFLRGH